MLAVSRFVLRHKLAVAVFWLVVLAAVYLPKIPSAQVGQLFGFGGGRMSWLLREGPLAAA